MSYFPEQPAVVGTGIDLASVARIARVYQRHPQRFARRVLNPRELAWFEQRGARARDLAKFFAVKEAASKALGTGMGAGVSWHQLELWRKSSGAPRLRLHDTALRRLHQLGGVAGLVSLADEGDLVIAQVVLAARLESASS